MKISHCIFILFGLAAFSALPVQGWALTGTYEQTVSINGQLMATFQITVKEQHVRAKTNVNGQEEETIRNQDGTFRFVPSQQVIFKLPDEVNAHNLLDDIDNYKEFLAKNNAVMSGTESLGGKLCDVYEFEDPISGGQSTAWVWQEKQFPLRIKVMAPEGEIVVEMSNVDLDKSVDDNAFLLPPNVKQLDVQEMLKNIQAQKEQAQLEAPPAS